MTLEDFTIKEDSNKLNERRNNAAQTILGFIDSSSEDVSKNNLVLLKELRKGNFSETIVDDSGEIGVVLYHDKYDTTWKKPYYIVYYNSNYEINDILTIKKHNI